MLKKSFAVLYASVLLLQCGAGLVRAATRSMRTASGARSQGDRTYDGSTGSGAAGTSTPARLAGPGSGTPKILGAGKVEPKVESGSAAPPSPGADKKKAEADAPPTDMTAVMAAGGLGLAGAVLGMALGGPMGACAGFLIGVFVGALAAKVYEYVKEKQEAKKNQ